MNILSLENVSKDFGFNPLFSNVTLGFEERDRVGIIGTNGSGKSTFLKMIAGLESSDSGRIIRTNGKSLAYLVQNPQFEDDLSVIDTIFLSESSVMKMIGEYESLCAELTEDSESDTNTLEKISRLQHELEISGGWEIETNARSILTRLGITDTTAKMKTLSGGQRKRVALAHQLIVEPDILILDEPTNHLDADTIEWFEDYLARYKGVLLLVTHDRYFLDRVTNRILEISRGTIQSFSGNYAYYIERKAESDELRAVENHKREQLIKKELAWLRRGAKARTRKSKHRIAAAHDLMTQPKEQATAEVDITIGSRRLGSKIIEIDNISKHYDGITAVQDFSYLIKRSDRIGIIGPNGSGKTTLLEMISGRKKPDSGSIDVGTTVVIGYYDQESQGLNEEQRVIDYIRDVAEFITTADGVQITAGKMLERFLFTPAMQYAVIGKLSGGEQRRLYLLRILMNMPNVLLLDEPTNDLDIQTLITLEEYLDDFGGALIVVSHDRYFLDRTVDNIFKFELDGGIREFAGNYTAYSERIEAEKLEAESIDRAIDIPQNESISKKPADAKPQKLSFKENRELEAIEKEITEIENRLPLIEREMADSASDAGKVGLLFDEQNSLSQKLASHLERWSNLADRAD